MKIKLLIIILLLNSLLDSPNFSKNISIEPTFAISEDLSRDYAIEFQMENLDGLFDLTTLEENIWFTQFNVSKLWKFNTISKEVSSITMPVGVTPLFINRANDNSIWFLDYDFSPQNETDYIVRFEPKSNNLTLFELPKFAHTINFELQGNFVIASVLNMNLIIIINTNTLDILEISIPCEGFCGPSSGNFDSFGNLWISETLGDRYVKYSFVNENFTFFELPDGFRAPVYGKIDDKDNIWTGSHAGDRIAKINTTDQSIFQYITPQTFEDQFPISGIN